MLSKISAGNENLINQTEKTMNFTASVIAQFLKGRVEGDPEASISDVSKIEEGKPGTLSFLANPKYEKYIYDFFNQNNYKIQ